MNDRAGHSAHDDRLALVRSPGVRVVLLIAPAGYGKTSLAAALRPEYARSAVCECDSTDVKEFVRRVLSALATEQPNESVFFSGLIGELSTLDDTDEAACRNILNAAWARDPGRSLFIFENAEAMAGSAVTLSFFTEMLNTAPQGRRIVVCSRVPLPARASRHLPPHRISTISTAQLSLTNAEALDVLEQEGAEPADRERILNVARGWPVVLLLLARLSREGRLDTALADANDISFEDLFVYFVHEVLEPLGSDVKQVMTLCARVPEITSEELRVATGLSERQLDETLRNALLVTREGMHYSIHPLVREVVLGGRPSEIAPLELIAKYAVEREDYRRAAQLYRLAGNHDAAAGALNCLTISELETAESNYDLMQLPLAALRKYPRLIGVAAENRADVTQEVLHAVFSGLSNDDDPEGIVAVAQAYSDHLDLHGGLAVVNDPLVTNAARRSPAARTLLTGWAESLQAYFGSRAASVVEPLCEAYEVLEQANLPQHSARMAHYLETVLRWLGDREGCLYWQGVSVELGRRLGPRLRAQWLFLGVNRAWFWGDEQTARMYYHQLQTAYSTTHHPDYEWVLRALDVRTVEDALPLWDPGLTMYAQLMAAANTADPERRMSLVNRAQALVPPTMLALAPIVAQAACDWKNRRRICEELAAKVDPDEQAPLRAAIVAYGNGRRSFLDAFASHFERSGAAARADVTTTPQTLRLGVLNERIIVGENAIKLTSREAALLTLLARKRIGTPREEIQDAIWPDLDENGARDALYSLLHRLRKRAGVPEIVEGIGNAYRLGAGVQVDLWDLEFMVQKVQREPSGVSVAEAEDFYRALRRRAYPHLQAFEWFSQVEFRIDEMARTLARFLIDQAEAAGEDDAVLGYASELIQDDPCDEWANEIVIRLHLKRGERPEAGRAYRRYCACLRQELSTRPSAEMQRLAAAI